jgi:hypothetical protein
MRQVGVYFEFWGYVCALPTEDAAHISDAR